MKIITKEMDREGLQSIVYLMDDTGRPLKAEIVSKEERGVLLNELLAEYFTPEDWANNKSNLLDNVEEITFEEYINQ